MKRLKYISALALSAILGMSSCSNDKLSTSAPSASSSSKGYKVSLTLNGNKSKTRAFAFNTGGFDREKAIDGTKLYAVVFDQQGKFSKTYDVEGYNSSTGDCYFTLDEAGVYYGYIVANTSKGTALKALTTGTSIEDDFYNIIEDTDPGSNNETSTNFLMTSKRTLFDVDGDSKDALDAAADGTDLGNITLTRAVARIDIDATAITGQEITKVEVENRVVKSLLVRGSSPSSLTSQYDTETYTRGTGAGQIPALDGTTASQDHAYVDAQQWQGVIYGYENIDDNTVVKITHTLNGVASTTTVDFSTINGGQRLKRNNVYTVKLVNEALTPTLTSIAAAITVLDWDDSVTLQYTSLTDNNKPDFKVTSSHFAFGYTDVPNELNPAKVFASKSDAPTEILLKITSTGKVGSEVAFVNKTGDGTYKFLDNSIGGKIEQVGSPTYVDGKIVQNYKITIPQAVITAMSGTDYLTFKVHNVFDDTATGSREYQVYNDIYEGISVGDLIYQDGTWSTAANRSSAEFSSKTPVAIVFATADEITMPDYDIEQGYSHGYAMALKENGTGYQWSTSALTTYVTDYTTNVGTIGTLAQFNLIRYDLDGLKHCAKIQEKIDAGTYTLILLSAKP